MPKGDKLQLKQKLFCKYYVKKRNATEAAIKAGYSPKTADRIGGENLKKLVIQNEIARLNANIFEALDISAVDIAREYQKIAFANISDTRTDWITLQEFEALSPDVKAAISEISTEARTTFDKEGDPIQQEWVKIKMHDKVTALKNLSLMIGVAGSEKREITGANGAPIKTDSTHEVIFRDMTGKSISPDEV